MHTGRQDQGALDLLGTSFQLIHIPIDPHEFPLEKLGFARCKPDEKVRREVDYQHQSVNSLQNGTI
jgi:hypothetical protein